MALFFSAHDNLYIRGRLFWGGQVIGQPWAVMERGLWQGGEDTFFFRHRELDSLRLEPFYTSDPLHRAGYAVCVCVSVCVPLCLCESVCVCVYVCVCLTLRTTCLLALGSRQRGQGMWDSLESIQDTEGMAIKDLQPPEVGSSGEGQLRHGRKPSRGQCSTILLIAQAPQNDRWRWRDVINTFNLWDQIESFGP